LRKLPKVLLLSRSVPPGVTGSSIIVSNLARQFTRDEMTVVGANALNKPPVMWHADYPKLHHATINMPDGTRGGRYIHWFQFPLLLAQVIRLIFSERCDLLLTVYPDMIYLFAGYLASVITGKPLFVYFHNTLAEAKSASPFAHWLQARVFDHARYVYVMSAGMQALYAERYPHLACEPLVHTFNEQIPDFESIAPALDAVQTPLHIVFSGNLNASNRGAFAVVAQLLTALPDARFTIYTGSSLQHFKNLGFEGERVGITSVSRDILIGKLGEADVLLLPHGFTSSFAEEETRTIFPTKVIEYLLSGRPIVALLPADCFLADFLRQNDCALLVTETNPELLKQAVQRVTSDPALRRTLVSNALRAAQQFYAPTVAAKLRDSLRQQLERLIADKPVQPDARFG
jgi:glycosyltransferase involved in cell wall biosynthesis